MKPSTLEAVKYWIAMRSVSRSAPTSGRPRSHDQGSRLRSSGRPRQPRQRGPGLRGPGWAGSWTSPAGLEPRPMRCCRPGGTLTSDQAPQTIACAGSRQGPGEAFHPKIVRDRVRALRRTVIALPATSRGFARDRINGTAQAYDQLAERGQRLLGRTRQRATPQQLVEQAQRRVRRARAARAGTASLPGPGADQRRSRCLHCTTSPFARLRGSVCTWPCRIHVGPLFALGMPAGASASGLSASQAVPSGARECGVDLPPEHAAPAQPGRTELVLGAAAAAVVQRHRRPGRWLLAQPVDHRLEHRARRAAATARAHRAAVLGRCPGPTTNGPPTYLHEAATGAGISERPRRRPMSPLNRSDATHRRRPPIRNLGGMPM